MNAGQIANHLEGLARDVRATGDLITLPQQEYALSEAMQKLRNVVGDGYVSISLPDINWHSTDRKPVLGEWGAYDGHRHYKGESLAAAVNACIEAHSPKAPADPVAALETELSIAPLSHISEALVTGGVEVAAVMAQRE